MAKSKNVNKFFPYLSVKELQLMQQQVDTKVHKKKMFV